MKRENREFPKAVLKFIQDPSGEELDLTKKKKSDIKDKSIVYFKISSGVIIKIDRENFTAYRFNKETKEWQEDSVLFTEYDHGNLDGEEFEATENYPYGEPFRYKSQQ